MCRDLAAALRILRPVDFDPDDLAAVGASLLGSPEQIEMAVRARQSLELTDALWDLVPVVIAAGEQRDGMSPAEVADATSSGRRLSAEVRARVCEAAHKLQVDVGTAFYERSASQPSTRRSALSSTESVEVTNPIDRMDERSIRSEHSTLPPL
jgi:hypothetical protein